VRIPLGGTPSSAARRTFVSTFASSAREIPASTRDVTGAGQGIPEGTLLDIVATVGRTDREEAKNALAELRKSGEIVEGSDQHPDAGVQSAENAEDPGDESVES